VAGATETNFLWDREQVLMELNAAGATAARYTLAPFGHGDLVSQRRSSVSGFYHFDALGTTRRVTAADESTQLTYVRDAFGSGIASTGTTTNRFRYVGKLGYVQEDTLAGALLRRRYYQYELGRFVSRDPVRDPGRSEYGYVRNAPTRAVDPGGLRACKDRWTDAAECVCAIAGIFDIIPLQWWVQYGGPWGGVVGAAAAKLDCFCQAFRFLAYCTGGPGHCALAMASRLHWTACRLSCLRTPSTGSCWTLLCKRSRTSCSSISSKVDCLAGCWSGFLFPASSHARMPCCRRTSCRESRR